jgi:hypothetical protein
MIRRIFAFFYEQSFVYPAQCERKHRSDGNMKSLYYMSYKIAGRWTSTGADVPYGLVERLTPKRPGKWKSLLDYGWTKDSKLRVVYRVSNRYTLKWNRERPGSAKVFHLRNVFSDYRRQLTDGNAGCKRAHCLETRTVLSQARR